MNNIVRVKRILPLRADRANGRCFEMRRIHQRQYVIDTVPSFQGFGKRAIGWMERAGRHDLVGQRWPGRETGESPAAGRRP